MGKQLCLGCMRSIPPGEQVCPVCGYRHGTDDGNLIALRPGTILNNIYLVGKVIGQGGFGITYVGYDLMLEMKVAIKEYFPMGMVSRADRSTVVWSQPAGNNIRQLGINNFVKEARKMAKLEKIPSVVSVKSVFAQNDTAYIVMDFIEGKTLKTYLKENSTMSFGQCVSLLMPVMQAMERVNQQGIIHRDISPDNIMLDTEGNIHLLDLGAAKDISIQQGDGSVSSQLVAKHGFSPLEQYMQHSNIGSWTDVYAMSATIYFCVTGRMPPQATDRAFLDRAPDPLVILPPLTQAQFDVIRHGMAIQPSERIQTMAQLFRELRQSMQPAPMPKTSVSPKTVTASAVTPKPVTSNPAPPKPVPTEPIPPKPVTSNPVPPKQVPSKPAATKSVKPTQLNNKRTVSILIAAASALIALCSGLYAWQTQSSSPQQSPPQSVVAPAATGQPTAAATSAPTAAATAEPTAAPTTPTAATAATQSPTAGTTAPWKKPTTHGTPETTDPTYWTHETTGATEDTARPEPTATTDWTREPPAATVPPAAAETPAATVPPAATETPAATVPPATAPDDHWKWDRLEP